MKNITAGRPEVLDEADPQINLGAEYHDPDGIRKYRYVLAGVSALVVGDLLQGPAEDTGDQGITPTATAAGATQIVTSSTMTVTANQYAGGYVTVTVTPGLGQTFRIKSHAAYTTAAATFTLESPVQVALTTDSRIDFVANPYNGVILSPASRSRTVVGVAGNNITASQYGWIQVAGPCNVLSNGALTVGSAVVRADNAGAVEVAANGTTEAFAYVGDAITGVDSGENGMVYLRLS